MELIVLDIETTGFVTQTDAILEIGITHVNTITKKVKIIFDKVIRDPVFNERMHKNAWIFNNSDLKIADVIKAPKLEEVQDELQEIFDKYPATAHNKAFDLRFLRHRNFKINDIKCLMQSCRQYKLVLNHKGKTKAPSVEEVYQVLFPDETYVETHRGGDDSLHEGKILLKLCDIKAGKFKPTPLILSEEYAINKRLQKKTYPKNFAFS